MKNLLSEIEKTVLQWEETDAKDGDFGARMFLYRRKEFGHLHDYGDLDIFFRKNIETKLLENKLVIPHKFVPKSGVTFTVTNEETAKFALSLLRFSYLLHYRNANADSDDFVETAMKKLPESLSKIYFENL